MHALKKRRLKYWLPKSKFFRWVISFLACLGLGLGIFDYVRPLNLSRFNHRSSLVLDENGQLISSFLSVDGYWRFPLRLEDVGPQFLRLLIAFEDKRFFYHPGIDPIAIIRALWQWKNAGRVVSGGSTLTLQVVRLLEPRPRTLWNKLKEFVRAIQLELHFSKKEILEIYISLAPYGGNIEGVRAASLAYFGKEPKQLTIAEATLLIAIPQKPNYFKPNINPKESRINRDKVIKRMGVVGALNQKEITDALEDAIPTALRPFPRHALHLAYAMTTNHKSTKENTYNTLFDLPIYSSTLNHFIQKQLEEYLQKQVEFLESSQTISAIIVDNKTYQVKAYVGSADFFNVDRLGQIDMVRAIRSPGSTLKPFIYALAFDDGFIHPETLIQDTPTAFGEYAPSNLKDVFHGTITIRDALQQSLNVPAVAILDKLGPGRFSAHLKNLGVVLKFDNTTVNPSLPLALGGVGMRLYDLVGLYVALANQGQFKPLVFENKNKQKLIKNSENGMKNDTMKEVTNETKTLMSAIASQTITRILQDAPAPDGFVDAKAITRASIAFKTGTSYGYRDAWAMGYTPDYTVGVWVGKPDGTPSLNQLGRTHALPILFRIFSLLPQDGRMANDFRITNSRELPLVLQEFKTTSKTNFKNDEKSLKMIFPRDNAVISLEKEGTTWHCIPISLVGGKPPFYIFENGHPLETYFEERIIYWQPRRVGFVELTILDSEGQSATINVELKSAF